MINQTISAITRSANHGQTHSDQWYGLSSVPLRTYRHDRRSFLGLSNDHFRPVAVLKSLLSSAPSLSGVNSTFLNKKTIRVAQIFTVLHHMTYMVSFCEAERKM